MFTSFEVHPERLAEPAIWITLTVCLGMFFGLRQAFTRHMREEERIKQTLPDIIEVIYICLSSGQSLDQSLTSTAKYAKETYTSWAKELEQILLEIRAGSDRTEAYRNFADRHNVVEIKAFASSLINSSQHGASASESMKSIMEQIREKQIVQAEELANKLPVKMTLASMFLTVPPLLIILLGPALHEMYSTLVALNR